MFRTIRRLVPSTLILALPLLAPSLALAQRHHAPAPGHAVPHHAVSHRAVVFVGGYFYDPFFGPYPWWPRYAYPYPYYPIYDNRAILRVLDTPKQASVYIDGFYAGVADDFNGFFEGVPLTPGGHEIALYLEGYRTVHRRVYLSPGSTFKFHEPMEPLPAGESSEPVRLSPALPPPPEGTFIPPRTAARTPAPPAAGPTAPAAFGTLSLRVRPAQAEVWIDGERWTSSEEGRFVIQLAIGPHRIEIVRAGFREYSSEVQVREGQTLTLNVSLASEQS
jgi:hypothetical protein